MEEKKTQPTRWQRYIADLYVAGWNQQLIASHLKCEASTISRLRTGETRKPGRALGERLKRLASTINGDSE